MADQCDPELGANTDPELGANTDPELGANTDPELGANTDPELGANTDPELGANTDPELGANTDPGEPMEEGPGLTVQLGGTYLCQKPDGTYQDVEVVEMRSNEQAQSEEYMVCYTGMPCRQTEWVDKTRLVLRKLPRDEYSEEGNVRGMLESGQRPDADEPKTKKAKVEDRGAASGSSLSRASASDTPLLRGKDAPSKHCAIHNMQIKLYCKDDGVLCCVICRDSLKHLNHKFLTIQDAVVACRADLSDTINSMEETLNELKELGGPPTDNAEQRKIDVPECKQNIVSGFEKLYASLEEQKRKIPMLPG
ncbi:nuclear factor 7, ovary-like [Gastrophryne carolinensis]